MRSHRATHNLVAVSAGARETGINVAQTLDTSMLVSLTDVLNLDPRRESNADELRGKEEADAIYDNGSLSSGAFNFEKGQPQHFAFLLAYALGNVSTAASGSGWLHTIRPIDGDVDLDRSLPSFTAGQRFGKTVYKRRFVSMFVDQVTASFAEDSWVKVTGTLKGTGKSDRSVTEETVQAAANAASLALAANGVHGADAQTRLDNVQRIRAELTPGVWTEVPFSAVSADTPAVITITPPAAGTDVISYKVLYAPTEPAWCAFPSRVEESPLRVAQLQVAFGGRWDGAQFQGGRTLSSEIKSIEWTLNNNIQIGFRPGAGGGYATSAFREGRVQTLKLSRELRDFIVQAHMESNDTVGMRLLAVGAEYEAGKNYQVEIVFPRLGVLTAPASVDGKRLAEAGDLTVLEDDTHGSVIVRVQNKVAAYAA